MDGEVVLDKLPRRCMLASAPNAPREARPGSPRSWEDTYGVPSVGVVPIPRSSTGSTGSVGSQPPPSHPHIPSFLRYWEPTPPMSSQDHDRKGPLGLEGWGAFGGGSNDLGVAWGMESFLVNGLDGWDGWHHRGGWMETSERPAKRGKNDIRCGSRPCSTVSSTNLITSTYEYSYGTIDQSPKAFLPSLPTFLRAAEALPWGE